MPAYITSQNPMHSPFARSSLFRSTLAALIMLVLSMALSSCASGTSTSVPSEDDDSSFGGSMTISSPAFENGASFPSKYTCDDLNIVPPLRIGNMPRQAESIAILLQDPDATNGTFTHWIVWNIDARNGDLPEGEVPAGAVEGRNGAGQIGYTGPCPPSGTHRYVFRLYALDGDLDLAEGADVNAFLQAIEGRIVDDTRFRGVYQRNAGSGSSVTSSVTDSPAGE